MTTDTSLHIFDTLHDLLHLFRCEIRQDLEANQEVLTFGELRVLVFIGRTPNCTQKTLVAHSRTDKAQIARTLAQLKNKGLITRSRKPEDRRVHLLHLSDEGQVIFARLNQRRASIARRLLADYPAEQQTLLLQLLQQARQQAYDSESER